MMMIFSNFTCYSMAYILLMYNHTITHWLLGTFVQNILQSLLLRSCCKVLTIVLLLILLKKLIFITNCNVCYSNFILAL